MIKVLEKSVADKIAAGEVIERPISIVKELVENSVDAGASSIVVEIRNGGKSYIRVTDDGCGIPEDEVELAFLRHATSKIQTVQDLAAIDTLGFRGEALASVGAVSRTEILTKCKAAKTGKRIIFHGGEILTSEKTGCPDGTTLVVTDLFYNTPARLKFMKGDGAESGLIIDFLSQMALAYKNIRFRLINNGNVIFSTLGDGDRFHTIVRVYKNIDPKNLTVVNHREGSMELEGYISTPAESKTSRSSQIFFVNGRVVNSKTIEKGLTEGYRERLFEGRYPVAYLFLKTDPADLDVNIHPNKREVRFDREKEVIDFISRAVKEALGTKEAMVNVGNIFKETGKEYKSKKDEQVDIKQLLSNIDNGETADDALSDIPASIRKIPLPAFQHSEKEVFTKEVFTENNTEEGHLTIDPPSVRPFDFHALTITGCVFHTYITATDEDAFYFIDQHAAHERIFYEKLVGEYEREEKLKQPILFPLILNIPLVADENRFGWYQALGKMGFSIDEFGQNTYRITEIPTFMNLQEAEDFLQYFVDHIDEAADLKNKVVIDKLIMRSCKSAVKANDVLSMEEIQALIRDLSQCVNPFSCPHGRPTFIRLTRYELERLFKRIQ